MEWYEDLFGVLAMLVCFVGTPIAVLVCCCVIVGADADEREAAIYFAIKER